MTFTIYASKDGQSVTTVRIGPTITVAKARELSKYGWDVHITAANGTGLTSSMTFLGLTGSRRSDSSHWQEMQKAAN